MSEYVEQVRKQLGKLAVRQMKATGGTFRSVAEKMGGQPSTFRLFTTAESSPHASTLTKIEDAIEWKRGVILEVLDGAKEGRVDEKLNLAYLAGMAPAERASQLSDEELLSELTARIEQWRQRLGDDPVKVPMPGSDAFDLAAGDAPGVKEDDAP
jgi:hypothetical protein